MTLRRLVVLDPRRTLLRARTELAEGTRVLVVDALGCETKAELLAAFARDLALPAWFGHNLDALEEALLDTLGDGPVALFVLEDEALEPKTRKALAAVLTDVSGPTRTVTALVRSALDESE